MDDWASGYVADVEYGSAYYGGQLPELANLIALICGYAPRDLQNGYTCCELGCGTGSTIATLAAADGRGRFFGVDFNPAHIASGLEVLQEAKIDTVSLSDASFAELLDNLDELPDFDIITLHGVYSWVAADVRQQIVRFLDAKLKPGGIVYISYNSLPGWLNCLPLQRLMQEYGRRLPGTSIDQAHGGFALLERLAETQAIAVVPENPFLDHIRKAADVRYGSYLAHEYMNAVWQPMYFREVAQDLSAARLKFIGSANIFDNYPGMCLSEEQRAIVDSMPDPILRETVRDYCQAKLLRRDIFVRGPRRLEPDRTAAILGEQWFTLIGDPDKIVFKVRPPRGEAELPADRYGPVIEALKDGPKPIGHLAQLPAQTGGKPMMPVELAGILTASGWAMPIGPTLGAPDPQRAGRFNAALARRMRTSMTFERLAFAAPVFRMGLPIDGFEALMLADWLDGMQDAETLAQAIWQRVQARGEDIVHEGEAITDPEQRTQHLMRRANGFLNVTIPRLVQGGAL